jgi:hypothetical protein
LTAGTNPNLGSSFGNSGLTIQGNIVNENAAPESTTTRWKQFLVSGGAPGYPTTVPDVRPTSTAGFPTASDCRQIDTFFDTTNYIGALNPSGSNWIDTPLRTDGNTATWPISYRRWIGFDVH